MANKNLFIKSLLTVFFVLVFAQNANAGADWKKKQKHMFEQIAVKPGDVIGHSNWEKVKGLVSDYSLSPPIRKNNPNKIG